MAMSQNDFEVCKNIHFLLLYEDVVFGVVIYLLSPEYFLNHFQLNAAKKLFFFAPRKP